MADHTHYTNGKIIDVRHELRDGEFVVKMTVHGTDDDGHVTLWVPMSVNSARFWGQTILDAADWAASAQRRKEKTDGQLDGP
jgi:hypothetical protein